LETNPTSASIYTPQKTLFLMEKTIISAEIKENRSKDMTLLLPKTLSTPPAT
jgi:hypothetical protein